MARDDARDDGTRDRRKVAVLGAGPAGLSAAFALSRTPELRARFAVTIYQSGWRAGGKSASGRAMDKGWRIEQNGSHYLFGCYGNSFEMLREAYEVLNEHGVEGFGDYREQLVPRNLIVSTEPRGDGTAEHWFRHLPETPAWPDRGGKVPPPSHFFFVGLQLLLGFLLGLVVDTAKDGSRAAGLLIRLFPLSPFHQGLYPRVARGCALVVAWVLDVPLTFIASIAWRLLRLLAALVPPLRALAGRFARGSTALVARSARGLCRALDPTVWGGPRLRQFGPARRFHRLRILVELLATAVVGALADRLWEAGRLEAIDGLDFREWLTAHGATGGPGGAVTSPLVKTWYDAVVAYEDGDGDRPRISAAVTLHALYRAIATYKGAFAFQMTHEIGDSFVAPIVKALELRGVKLEFFQRVRDVIPGRAGAGDVIERIEVEAQLPEARRRKHRVFVTMEPTGGDGAPLPRKVWPNRPVFEDDPNGYDAPQAAAVEPPLDSHFCADGGRRRTLARGADFDDVVFALPPGVVADLPALRDRPGWLEMRTHVAAIGTQSMRLWFTKGLPELGWTAPAPILSAFAYPYSTWEDNGQNRGSECFGSFDRRVEPSGIATLFGPLAGGNRAAMSAADAQALQRRAESAALAFYGEQVGALWPLLEASPHEKWSALLSPEHLLGVKRFEWQYTRANVGPVEAYVLALPGTLRHRLRPDETGFRNMVAAGEWTRNGFEVGCVEGAVISGLAAARALAGQRGRILGEDELTFGLFERHGPTLRRPRHPNAPERLSA